jgi:hypothetical protein
MRWIGWAWDPDAGRWCRVSEADDIEECVRKWPKGGSDVPTDWRGLTGGAMPSWVPKMTARKGGRR